MATIFRCTTREPKGPAVVHTFGQILVDTATHVIKHHTLCIEWIVLGMCSAPYFTMFSCANFGIRLGWTQELSQCYAVELVQVVNSWVSFGQCQSHLPVFSLFLLCVCFLFSALQHFLFTCLYLFILWCQWLISIFISCFYCTIVPVKVCAEKLTEILKKNTCAHRMDEEGGESNMIWSLSLLHKPRPSPIR